MRIDENKFRKLIESCIYEAITNFQDSKGEEHVYDPQEIKKSLYVIKNNKEIFNTICDCFERGGWEFSDIIRSEGGWTTLFATPKEGARVREFGMVAGLISNKLGNMTVRQGSYDKNNTDDTIGLHYIAIKL